MLKEEKATYKNIMVILEIQLMVNLLTEKSNKL